MCVSHFLLHGLDEVCEDKQTTDAPDLASTYLWHEQIAVQKCTLTLEGQVATIVNPYNEVPNVFWGACGKQIVNFSSHCRRLQKKLSHTRRQITSSGSTLSCVTHTTPSDVYVLAALMRADAESCRSQTVDQ